MYLAFGMIVVGSDGVEVGTLDRALVDPARRQLTHVVVWSPRLQADVLVPLGLVQGSTNRRLLLHSTSSALENMPRYEAGRTLELGAATRVSALDGAEGQLVGLAAEETTYRLSEVIVGGFRDRELVIPAPWVAGLRPGWIMLGATRDHLNRSIGFEAGPFGARRSGPPRRVVERGIHKRPPAVCG